MTMLRTSTHRAPLPVLRAAVFAAVGTVLGVSAHHLIAEGSAPWRQSAWAAAVLFGIGLAGARRPRTLGAVMATSAGAQVGLHLWLSTAHAHAAPTMAMPMPMHGHHTMDTHGAWHERLHGSLAMTAVHAVAAVLVAVLLHRADAACWSLARGLTAVADGVQARLATVWALLSDRPTQAEGELPTLALEWTERPPPEGAVLAHVVVRRGPPPAGFVLAN
ncbi:MULTISPECIES: hypothetical protein [unclassified Streptomyces]|uniref:hypothetical protein n=1 Tax=unclassified Streptomyces TaxID=2593676 RepID=UPI002E806979|nr:hypothetical protein [Streptomyces sp. NBC_00589]WTI35054.1 hypothetical protein OIC96_08665 [Streptomyces sp. NBC_00775]WUB31272.1 hypothetical protein OHA51_41065 [Streptomyces sp. NBC_00589]